MEIQVFIDLTKAPTTPQLVPETIGQVVTGVIVNNILPAGLTLSVGRKGTNAMITLGGAPGVGKGGDALLDYWCPPQDEGMSVQWDVDAPGSFAILTFNGPDDGRGGAGSAARG